MLLEKMRSMNHNNGGGHDPLSSMWQGKSRGRSGLFQMCEIFAHGTKHNFSACSNTTRQRACARASKRLAVRRHAGVGLVTGSEAHETRRCDRRCPWISNAYGDNLPPLVQSIHKLD